MPWLSCFRFSQALCERKNNGLKYVLMCYSISLSQSFCFCLQWWTKLVNWWRKNNFCTWEHVLNCFEEVGYRSKLGFYGLNYLLLLLLFDCRTWKGDLGFPIVTAVQVPWCQPFDWSPGRSSNSQVWRQLAIRSCEKLFGQTWPSDPNHKNQNHQLISWARWFSVYCLMFLCHRWLWLCQSHVMVVTVSKSCHGCDCVKVMSLYCCKINSFFFPWWNCSMIIRV